MRRRSKQRALQPVVMALVVFFSVRAGAEGPVLHELIPPDDGEDVALALTTAEGDLPAAMETRSGVVRAPDTQRQPNASESAYREPLSSSSSVFRPDRDTRRPSLVRYDDPFSPSIAPYKRLRAFDLVGADYGLRVRDTSVVRVPLGGEATIGEEQFYADLTVDFEASSMVLIPSVGPGARIIRQHVAPQIAIEVWRDGADNWFAKAAAPSKGRVHLVMQVAIPEGAFGGELSLPTWALLPATPPLPPRPARAFAKVQAAIGLSRALTPSETVKRLVVYFRGFTPSEDFPRGNDDIYLDLALSQKGVCRHRAFAFLVTALGLGIPARMVVNEAHAWVEVRGDRFWQRIDLGGAAGSIEEHDADARPIHRPPADTFGWPASAENGSGQAAAVRGRQSGRDSSSSAATSGALPANSPQSAPIGATPTTRPVVGGYDPASSSRADDRPKPQVVVRGGDVRVRRGEPIRVAGNIAVGATGCGQVRVDVMLQRVGSDRRTNVGALTTDASGVFDGAIYLPLGFPVGDYDLAASTPGDARCGAGASSP